MIITVDLVTLAILGAVAYRSGRFIQLDDLVDGTRDKLNKKLTSKPALWRSKLQYLLFFCPWCITVWTGFGVTLFWSLVVVGAWAGWAFLLWWPAVATVALVYWRVIDPE